MKLDQLPIFPHITGIHFHSAKIEPGNIFVAIQGFETDGHHYIDAAIEAGAAAVIGEQKLDALTVPYFQVDNSRLALADLADAYYGHPSKKHTIIGITGTNGKTTTAFMLRHILESVDIRCSLFGTVKNVINEKERTTDNTTPDPVQVQQWLNESNDPVVIMEVSSQGLDQHRVSGVFFDYAVFTNLTREHLDYHGSMEAYFEAKSKLFDCLKPDGKAVINSDCPWSENLIQKMLHAENNFVTYGEKEEDHLSLIGIDNMNPSSFTVNDSGIFRKFTLPVPGAHNVSNALAALLTADRLGIESEKIIDAISTFTGVPGRFETYHHPSGANVIIDYAHTPHGLEKCLETVKITGARKITHIFGFRGKRGVEKWLEMINISAHYSDEIILTFDDLNGVSHDKMIGNYRTITRQFGNKCTIIADRTKAIETAWCHAEDGDRIVITGKGHETYRQPFSLLTKSDKETVEYLSKKPLLQK
jgi:UDP-N-acetylmuramoyl-L-alanyl-D-glutamate--2,6-diaminopimelate ligase